MRRAADRTRRRAGGAIAPSSAILAWLALALALAWPARALAHEVGLSRGEYAIDGATVTAELIFAQRDVVAVAPEIDADRSGAPSAAELQQGSAALTRAIAERLVVEGDGRPCPGKLVAARATEGDGTQVSLSYACAAPPSKVRFDLVLLEDLPYGHRHIFEAEKGHAEKGHAGGGAALTESILYRKRRSIEVLRQPEGAPPGGTAPVPAPSAAPDPGAPAAGSTTHPQATGALDFFTVGIEHILLGYDHLVFLLGLVLIGGRWRALLLVVTAFTVAHSITLGLAVLGVWAPSAGIIEPAIALSIAYVGLENFFVDDAEKRWRITFPFGLVHGFGFAGALGEISVPRAEIPGALLAFNLGVEAGQVAVLAAVLPLMALARRRGWLERTGVKVASGLIILAGVSWFVLRVTGG